MKKRVVAILMATVVLLDHLPDVEAKAEMAERPVQKKER